jgi:hypothetical protein
MMERKREAWFRVQRFFALPPESYDHWTEIVKLEECKRDLLFIKECNRQEYIQRTTGIVLFSHPVRHLVQNFLDGESICQMDATCRKWSVRCATQETHSEREAICTIPPGCFGVSGDFAVVINATKSDGVTATLYSAEQWTIVAVDKFPVKYPVHEETWVDHGKVTKDSVFWSYHNHEPDEPWASVALTYCFRKREIALIKCCLPAIQTLTNAIACPQRGTLVGLEHTTEDGEAGFRLLEFESSGKNLLQSSPFIVDDCEEKFVRTVLFLRDQFIAVIGGERVNLLRQQGLTLFSSFPATEESRVSVWDNWRTDGDFLYCWDSDNDLVKYDVCGRKRCLWTIPLSVGSVDENEEWSVRGNLFFTISSEGLLSDCRLAL